MRKLFWVLRALHLDRLIFKLVAQPTEGHGADIGELLDVAQACFAGRRLGVAFAWPSVARSSGRVYAYYYDISSKEILAFAKIAADSTDKDDLLREISALAWVKDKVKGSVCIPEVISTSTLRSGVVVALFRLLPRECARLRWSESTWKEMVKPIKEILSFRTERVMSLREVEETPWFRSFSRIKQDLVPYLEYSCTGGVCVCATHGDMAQHNFCKEAERIWLYDWETFTLCGPALVDELTVYMSVLRFTLKLEMSEVMRRVARDYPMDNAVTARKVIQAAAFIIGNRLSFHEDFVQVLLAYGKYLMGAA